MKERMKVLIGYDGSSYADAALEDLQRAGLPREVEALVVTVVGAAVTTPPLASHEVIEKAVTTQTVTSSSSLAKWQAERELEGAQESAAEASLRLREALPGWAVAAEELAGAPAVELIKKAFRWKAELIVVGSQGRSALGRLILGSVSKRVATEACCSVRVARRVAEGSSKAGAPLIIVGIDGSYGAARAVRAVGKRSWPEGTEVYLIAVDDGSDHMQVADTPPSLEELIMVCNGGAPANARVMAEAARVALAAEGLKATVEFREGDPRRVLIERARELGADCVFVGALGVEGDPGDPGLGRVSTGLVTGAHCSVEVAR